jgi:hypothetical protein
MVDWYEVYDNEQVQLKTRRQVSRLLGVLLVAVGVSIAILPIVAVHTQSMAAAAGAAGVLVMGAGLWVGVRTLRLRCVVWCIKLSFARIVGYDYARRKSVLDWSEVERIELGIDGIAISARPGKSGPRMLKVPHLFPDFAKLSHRLVEYAEAHHVPVCIDGRPWQLLDVAALYPFISDCAIAAPVSGRWREDCDD